MFKHGDKVVRSRGRNFGVVFQGGIHIVDYMKTPKDVVLQGLQHAGMSFDANHFDLVQAAPAETSTIQKVEELQKQLLALQQQLADEKAAELAKAEKTYSIGQRFNNNSWGTECILAQVDYNKCAFINLNDGNRFTDPVSVKCVSRITAEEFEQLQGHTGEFTLINS